MFFSFCPLLSSVWLPEQWGPESWCLLFKLVACSSVWPPAINGYFQPCFWKRHERLLWQRAPQLQHRYWHLPESTPSTAGLYHGTHTCGKWGGGLPFTHKNLSQHKLDTLPSCVSFSGVGHAKGSIRSFCVHERGCYSATDAALLSELRREAHVM